MTEGITRLRDSVDARQRRGVPAKRAGPRGEETKKATAHRPRLL